MRPLSIGEVVEASSKFLSTPKSVIKLAIEKALVKGNSYFRPSTFDRMQVNISYKEDKLIFENEDFSNPLATYYVPKEALVLGYSPTLQRYADINLNAYSPIDETLNIRTIQVLTLTSLVDEIVIDFNIDRILIMQMLRSLLNTTEVKSKDINFKITNGLRPSLIVKKLSIPKRPIRYILTRNIITQLICLIDI